MRLGDALVALSGPRLGERLRTLLGESEGGPESSLLGNTGVGLPLVESAGDCVSLFLIEADGWELLVDEGVRLGDAFCTVCGTLLGEELGLPLGESIGAPDF